MAHEGEKLMENLWTNRESEENSIVWLASRNLGQSLRKKTQWVIIYQVHKVQVRIGPLFLYWEHSCVGFNGVTLPNNLNGVTTLCQTSKEDKMSYNVQSNY